jgi:hypothetical protein
MPPALLKHLPKTCIPIILLILTTSAANGEQAKCDQIGTVQGRPVYRDQIAAEKDLSAELFRIFSIGGIANQYREKHHAAITPTEDEPPRCLSAWSRVRNQNVGPRETPRHRPARPGGAMFPRHAVGGGTRREVWRTAATSLEPRSTQARCVVAGRRFGGTRCWC